MPFTPFFARRANGTSNGVVGRGLAGSVAIRIFTIPQPQYMVFDFPRWTYLVVRRITNSLLRQNPRLELDIAKEISYFM